MSKRGTSRTRIPVKQLSNSELTCESQSSKLIQQKYTIGAEILQQSDDRVIDVYFELQRYYETKYGPQTVVIMQVGSFYEIYGYQINSINYGPASFIGELLGLQSSIKDKVTFADNAQKKALMIGFPDYSSQKWIDLLVENNYTIIRINQQKDVITQITRRYIDAIISPGTIIETGDDVGTFSRTTVNNATCVIYLDIAGDELIYGMAVVECLTGRIFVMESHSKSPQRSQERWNVDDMIQFIAIHRPAEYIFVLDGYNTITNSATGDKTRINTWDIIERDTWISLLNIKDAKIHWPESVDISLTLANEIKTPAQRNLIFESIWRNLQKPGISMPEILNLRGTPFAERALAYLIKFLSEHHRNICNNLQIPEPSQSIEHVTLGNNALVQLNIVDTRTLNTRTQRSRQYNDLTGRTFYFSGSTVNCEHNSDPTSLLQLLDITLTPMGQRLFRRRLLNPIHITHELNRRYNSIKQTIHIYNTYLEHFRQILQIMTNINDIDKIHRRLQVGLIHPTEFCTLLNSYEQIISVLKIINETGVSLNMICPFEINLAEIIAIYDDFSSRLILDSCRNITYNRMRHNIFSVGVNIELDTLAEQHANYKQQINAIIEAVINLYNSRVKVATGRNQQLRIELVAEGNTDGGQDLEQYVVQITDTHANYLRPVLSELRDGGGGNSSDDEKLRGVTIEQHGRKRTIHVLQSRLLNSLLEHLRTTEITFVSVLRTYYSHFIEIVRLKYLPKMIDLANIIAELDLVFASAKMAITHNYVCPEITNSTTTTHDNQSFIEIKDIRHPILESLMTSKTVKSRTKYVANDVNIGFIHPTHEKSEQSERNELDYEKKQGMLLYGVNASGKSCYMKSIGIALIMAQSGFFVAAKSMRFRPYTKIFTRILGSDNIFQGKSTFAVEMEELREILQLADNNTMVLGDELCSGTETTSGMAIVAAGVKYLINRGTSFVFATHLHQLAELPIIREISSVGAYHLEVQYDRITDKLIYSRKIKPGSGSSVYGLEVCKALQLPHDFLELAENIRKTHFITNPDFTTSKSTTTSYNSHVLKVELCQICKIRSAEDTHHIISQKFADSRDQCVILPSGTRIHKNAAANLVQLCKICHNKTHGGEINILGYITTSDGEILNWTTEIPPDPTQVHLRSSQSSSYLKDEPK